MEKIGKFLKISGIIGTAFHIFGLFLALYSLRLYDLQVQLAAEQGQYFRCFRRIYVNSVIGMSIWTCLSLIILGMGLLILYAVKNEKGKQQFKKVKKMLLDLYKYLYE